MRTFFPFSIRRRLRVALYSLLALLLLLAVALGGGLLFLRSDTGLRWVERESAALLASALQGSGLSVRFGGLKGPLPGEVGLSDLSLSDADGVWLSVPEVRLRLRLMALLRGTVVVEEALLRGATLYRLPQSARPATPAPADDTPFSFAALGASGEDLASLLPRLRLDGVRLEEIRIAPAVLGLTRPSDRPAADTANELASFPVLRLTGGGALSDWSGTLSGHWPGILDLDGTLRLGNRGDWLKPATPSDGVQATPTGTAMPAIAEPLPQASAAVRLALALRRTGPDAHSKESTAQGAEIRPEVRPKIRAEVLALLLSPDASQGALAIPLLALSLPGGEATGAATLSDTAVNGRFELRLDEPDTLTSALNDILTALGEKALPEDFLPLRGGLAELSLTGRPEAPELHIATNLRGLNLGADPVNANASLKLELTGLLPAREAGTTGQTPPSAQNVAKTFAQTSTQTLRLQGEAALSRGAVSDASGKEAPPLARLNIRLEAKHQDGNLELSDLACRLNGDMLHVTGTGRFAAADGSLAFALRGEVPSLAALRLSDFSAAPPELAGTLGLTLDAGTEPDKSGGRDETGSAPGWRPLGGTLRLSGAGMVWGQPELDKLLGPSTSASLAFSARPNTTSPLGADIAVRDFTLAAASLRGSGSASLTGPPPAESQAGRAGTAGTAGAGGAGWPELKADLALSLTSLAAFGPDLAGSLDLRAIASGSPASPTLELLLTSPRLSRSGTTLTALKARANAANLPLDALAAKESKGSLRLEGKVSSPGLTKTAGDPLSLDADWGFRLPAPGTPGEVSLRSIRAEAPGFKLSGNAAGRLLPPKTDGTGVILPELTGELRAAISDWRLFNAAAGLRGADALRGKKAALRLGLAFDKTTGQKIDVGLDVSDLQTGSVTLNRLESSVSLSDAWGNDPKLAARLSLGPGKAAERDWKRGELTVKGPLSVLAVALNLEGRLAAAGALTLDIPAGRCRVARLSVTDGLSGTGLRLNAPLALAFASEGKDRGLRVQGLDMALLPDGVLSGDAILSPDSLNIRGGLKNLALGRWRDLAPFPLPDGSLSADIALVRHDAGTFPSGECSLTITDIRYPDSQLPPLNLRMNAVLEKGRNQEKSGRRGPQIRAEAVLGGLGASDLNASLALPLLAEVSAAGLPQAAMGRPLSGEIRWQGAIAPLWAFVPVADRRLTGQGSVNAVLGGSLNAPELNADIRLSGAEYDDLAVGLMLADINADITLHSSGISGLKLSLGDGKGGSASLAGTIGSLAEGLPLALAGKIDNLAPLRRNDLSIVLSGEARIDGPALDPARISASADIVVDRGEFRIVGSSGSSIPTLDVVSVASPGDAAPKAAPAERPAASGPMLNAGITLPGRFFVRGKGLESEWGGKLRLQGPADNLRIEGSLSSVRGSLQLIGKDFSLTQGNVSFAGAVPPDPSLGIVLTYQGPTITAEASVSGTVSAPVLNLSSRPPLPQDEVVAQVLFGQSATGLSRLEALQLANELRVLAGFGSGGEGILDTARNAFGVDVLRFGSIRNQRQQTPASTGTLLAPGQSAASATKEESQGIPALEVGKYVMDNVYVGLEQGMNGDTGGVRVEIELSPSLNLTGSTTPTGSEVGVNWKKDY